MGSMRRLLLALTLIALVLGGGAAPAAADRWYAPAPVLGIVAAGRQPSAARQAGATWDRALFLWQLIQPNSPRELALDSYLYHASVQPSLNSGILLIGVDSGSAGTVGINWQ